MGYTVLYIAFGVVALWLLGEVLLQYKARLRWRALAFAGFMGVVAGVAMRSVVVIALGAIAFGAGQTIVTLSYRRGFSTGWALGGRPGASRRRRVREREWSEPALSVTPVEPVAEEPAEAPVPVAPAAGYAGVGGYAGPGGPVPGDLPVYQPEALLDDTGEYPSYSGASYGSRPDPYIQHDAVADGYGYDTAAYAGGGYVGYDEPDAYAAYGTGYAADPQSTYGYDANAYAPTGYDTQYAGYAPAPEDPYAQSAAAWNDTPYEPSAWLPHQQTDPGYPDPAAPPDPTTYDQYRY